MLWAACCLSFFGFLCAGCHLTHLAMISNLQGNALVDPTCFKVRFKCLKTDPFQVGCNIYVGRATAASTQCHQ